MGKMQKVKNEQATYLTLCNLLVLQYFEFCFIACVFTYFVMGRTDFDPFYVYMFVFNFAAAAAALPMTNICVVNLSDCLQLHII